METSAKTEIYLPEFVAEILTHHGGIVEKNASGLLEFLLPQPLVEKLGLPEHGRLNFAYSDSSIEAIEASYDSEFFTALKSLFQEQGKIAVATFPAYEPGTDKIAKTLRERLALANAIVALDKTETRDFSYLLVYFKYVALSDERQEGVVPILIHESNLSTIGIHENDREILEKLRQENPDTEKIEEKIGTDTLKALQIAGASAEFLVKDRLGDFVKSLERRLNRDIKRIDEYYQTLKEETKKSLEKKMALESKLLKDEKSLELEKLAAGKLNAILAEQSWKLQDLIAKYALRIQIEPLACLRIKTSSVVFRITIKRRLATRKFPVSYNPLIRQLDPLPCESCFFPDRSSYYICDDQLHIVCADCFSKCPHCQKQFCSACHKNGCPKCGGTKHKKIQNSATEPGF